MKKGLGQIFKIAIPSVIAGLSEPILSLTDNYFGSNIDDTTVSAIGLSTTIIMVITWVIGSTRGAISAQTAFLFGQKKQDTIASLYPFITIFISLIGLGCAYLVYLGQDYIIQFIFSPKQHIQLIASKYLSIRLIGFPFAIFSICLFATLRGLQNTTLAMYSIIAAGLLNVFLDYYFIEFWCNDYNIPFSEGLAWASCISQIVLAIIALLFTVYYITPKLRNNLIHFKYIGINSFHLLLRTIFLNAVFVLANRFALMGDDSTAATHIVFNNLWLFSAYFIDGFADAGLAISGKLKGRSNTEKILSLTKTLLLINIIIALCLSGTFFFFKTELANAFLHDQKSIITFTNHVHLLSIAIFLGAGAFTTDGNLVGLSETSFLRNNMFISAIVFISAHYVLQTHFDTLTAIWGGIWLWLIIRFVPAYFKIKKTVV